MATTRVHLILHDDRAEPLDAGAPRGGLTFSVVLVVLVMVPLVVTLISLIGTHWHPTSDNALEVLRVRDVGGRHTPLTGVQSRLGWDHPGPSLFWLLAPFRWVAGDTGILVGVACINGAAIVTALLLARRRAGLPFVVVLSVGILVLARALGASLLIDPWNPWVAVLPFLVYMLLAWCIADRDVVVLPALVAVGSFLVQTHVGYTPLVAGAGATAVALTLLRRNDEPTRGHAQVRKYVAISGVVAVVMWLAPLIQQFTGSPGNLGEIVDYFRHPTEKTLGIAYGFGLMGKELAVPGAWITGNDVSPLGFVFTAGTITALALLAAALLLAVLAWRRGSAGATRFACLIVATAWFGVLAGGRITGAPGSYLVRWWWVIAALLWCSLVWSLWCAVGEARLAPVLVPAGCAVIVVLATVVAWDAAPARVPGLEYSTAVGKLTPGTADKLSRDRRYVVKWVNSDALGAVGVGTYLELVERGFDVGVSPEFGHAFGSWRVARPGEVQGTITVVSSDSSEGFPRPVGAVQAAQYDPLTAADRRRAQEIEVEIRAHAGPSRPLVPGDADSVFGRGALLAAGIDPAQIDVLRELRRPGLAYAVFVVPPR
jgi:hypothetical protein